MPAREHSPRIHLRCCSPFCKGKGDLARFRCELCLFTTRPQTLRVEVVRGIPLESQKNSWNSLKFPFLPWAFGLSPRSCYRTHEAWRNGFRRYGSSGSDSLTFLNLNVVLLRCVRIRDCFPVTSLLVAQASLTTCTDWLALTILHKAPEIVSQGRIRHLQDIPFAAGDAKILLPE